MNEAAIVSPLKHQQGMLASPARRGLVQGGLVVSSSSSQTAVYNPMTKSDVFPSPAKSPMKVFERPVTSEYGFQQQDEQTADPELNLSDPVLEAVKTDKSVLLIDALSQRVGPAAEVTTREYLIEPHVKVVCHSPRAAVRSIKGIGYSSPAAKVAVDHLKSMILNHSGDVSRSRNLSSRKQEQTLSTNGSTNAGLEDETPISIDDITEAMAPPTTEETSIAEREKSEPRSKIDSSKSSAPRAQQRLFQSTTSSKARTQAIKSSGKFQAGLSTSRVASESSRPRPNTVAQPSSRTTTSSHSRVSTKTTSANRATASSTLRPAVKSAAGRSAVSVTTHGKPSVRSKTKVTSQTSVKTSGSIKPNREISTPERDRTIRHPADDTMDISAVDGVRGRYVIESGDSLMIPSSNKENIPVETQPSESRSHNKTLKKQKGANITQHRLDVQYARYLQYMFLSSKTQAAISSEESSALTQLGGLSRENSRLKKKLSTLTEEFDRLCHVTRLDEDLQLQKSSLSAVAQELPTLSRNYNNMAEALDTTRHELNVKGIYLPSSQAEKTQYEDSMVKSLNESEELISAVTSQLRRKTDSTNQFAQTMDQLASTVECQAKSLDRCGSLLSTAKSLANKENSLIVQQIELADVVE